jgi:hypothetical protein
VELDVLSKIFILQDRRVELPITMERELLGGEVLLNPYPNIPCMINTMSCSFHGKKGAFAP